MSIKTKSVFLDPLCRPIELFPTPQRIISVVPSLTELLYDLGLENNILAVTKFCVKPMHARKNKPLIGGTKNLRIQDILLLSPHLIIANKEENNREDILLLSQYIPVWLTDIGSIQDAINEIGIIGLLTNTEAMAKKLMNKIENELNSLLCDYSTRTPIKVCYLIWYNPIMTIGNDTFIHSMLTTCWFENIFSHQQRYPIVSIEVIKEYQPSILMLSSEPFPFKEKHIFIFQSQLPQVSIRLVDGEMFSWYGSRLLYAFSYIRSLL